MKRFMKRDIISVSTIALALVLGCAAIISASGGAQGDFAVRYPASPLGSSCTICHIGSSSNTNPYGTALRNNGGSADNIPDPTFTTVGPLDSDGDGFSNIDEINAGTFPGDRNDFPAVPAVIDLIVPAAGTLGTQFTITGSGLGDKKGKIVLSSDLVSATLKIANGGWTSTLISATLGKAFPPGTYDVTVYLQPYKTTSPYRRPTAITNKCGGWGLLSQPLFCGPCPVEYPISK